ncbi:hypothetical protein QCM80_40350 [Bradyrhizobium sp. SSUT112]|uniref:hypothetical protein n=1 Tax=Bradyrhizobium sp. SSUT112 TaxID=3040604 RepID=UPI00244B8F1D|nr:hypothetical protein [Bradyrhizobium sp. SSUT112]MDH2356823.1 hypothetical protein [Bradyrhizobium sp. SSUT112]
MEFVQTMIRGGSPSPVKAMAWILNVLAGLIGHCLLTPEPALGQTGLGGAAPSAREVVIGTGGLAIDQDRTQISSPLAGSRRNVDPAGKPCLSVSAHAEPQKINKRIYDHILHLENNCSKEIKIRACYYKTDTCQDISVGGYKKQMYVFGVFTTPDFRCAYREYVK